MSATIAFNLNRPAQVVIDEVYDHGFEPFVRYGLASRPDLLFEVSGDPSELDLAFVKAVVAKFNADAAFREDCEVYLICLGAAVHEVTSPAWKTRALTAEEMADIRGPSGGGAA